ncbi:MAG: beta strand repeat-containing protein [Wenzhouxiangella sp.]
MSGFCQHARKIVVALVLLVIGAQASAQTSTIQVNSLGDLPKSASAGTGTCWTGQFIGDFPPFAQECTLRAAIEAANERSGQINIEFASIPVGSNQFSTIVIGSALPTINRRVEIRGQTHPNWSLRRTNVLIFGSATGTPASYNGLTFGPGSNNSRVESIGISRVADALTIDGASNLTITGSYLAGGLAGAVSTARNGRDGLRLINSNENAIFGNYFRGNARYGVFIASGSSGNVLLNNLFGVRPTSAGQNPVVAPDESSTNSTGVFVASNAGTNNQIGSFTGNYFANQTNSAIRVFADGQLITSNRIGVPPDNGVAVNFSPEDYGLQGDSAIFLASSDNQVGTGSSTGNVIGNGDQVGILIGQLTPSEIAGNGNQIVGNRIGLDEDGLPFGLTNGIEIRNGSGTIVRNNTIAYNNNGILASSTSSGSSFRSNQILDNAESGIRMTGSGSIGGDSLTTANVIGGNLRGILIINSAGSVLVRNNYIGTDAEAANLGNTTGIQVQNNSAFVDIGQPGAGNIIGNSATTGLFLASGANDVWVQANWIGAHPSGTAIGNLDGIRISGNQAAFENRIGFRVSDTISAIDWLSGIGRGNVIANNSNRGVWVSGNSEAVRNSIRGNRFFANGGRDIDLGMSAVDPGGAATGPNTQLNWPEIQVGGSAFNATSGQGEIELRVQTLPQNASFPLRIDLYLIDPNTQMPKFLRTLEYPGSTGFVGATFPWPSGVAMAGQLLATATDQPGGPFANTSQFTAPPVGVSTGPGTLSTATQNNGVGGVFLDLQAGNSPVAITGFDLPVQTNTQAGEIIQVAVFVRDGSYVGHTDSSAGWQLHETLSYVAADLNQTPSALSAASLAQALQIASGQTKGVYLQTLDRVGSGGVRYYGLGSSPPQTSWGNADLSLFSDTATTADNPFNGPLFSPRTFSGIVRYELASSGDLIFQDRFE